MAAARLAAGRCRLSIACSGCNTLYLRSLGGNQPQGRGSLAPACSFQGCSLHIMLAAGCCLHLPADSLGAERGLFPWLERDASVAMEAGLLAAARLAVCICTCEQCLQRLQGSSAL